jgi:hypothetical protein
MHSGLRITDPIITTAYIARNHGYMIYDTLFAVDEKFSVKPALVPVCMRSRVRVGDPRRGYIAGVFLRK